MIVETANGPVYYEFKSVKDLPPRDFVEQFGKDLSRDNFSVDNLRWIFDGKKIQAKDLQRLRGKLETMITYDIARSCGYADPDIMIKELFNKVFIIK